MPESGTSENALLALVRDESAVVDRWTAIVAETLRGRSSEAEIRREITDLYRAIAADGGTDEVRAVLGELSRTRARQGFSPSETALSVFSLKSVLLELLEDRADLALYRDFANLSLQIDDLGLYTIERFTEAREGVIAEQAQQLLERFSTPVIKLFEGVLAVPLVGTLDSARTQLVMEGLLEALVETGSSYAIIDITGVPAVDTQVAQHLLKTIVAARLMGAECTISGIRPQIAQTIVSLGIEFGDIATKSTLAEALSLALSRSGYQVVNTKARGGAK